MIRTIIPLSLITSLLLFYIQLPWLALIPLILSMYITFTNGDLQKKNVDRQFSRYHILFGLWCTIITGLSLLLHVFGVGLLTILCSLVGIHMLVIRGTLIGKLYDEYLMFHIGYYFVSFVLLWYIPVTYGLHDGIIGWLLFPVITFLLYAGGTFFIESFVTLPLAWHYRTAVYFLISFLSSIILYFFSVPLIGWTAALVFYVGVIWFLVYQMRLYMAHEKRKNVYAEDILAGTKVIQQAESIWHSSQVFIARIIQKLSYSLRTAVVRCSALLAAGTIISAFYATGTISNEIIFLLLCIGGFAFHYANTGWNQIGYNTTGVDTLLGLYIHAIFGRVLYTYVGGVQNTSFIFIGMSWTIIHHGIAILLAKQAKYWRSKRKYPLLYGYAFSTTVASICIMILFSYLQLDSIFIRAVNLLYLGIIGTMVYFFSRALLPEKAKTRPMIDEE